MAHVPRLYRPGRLEAGPIALDADQSRRLGSVLRVRPGEEFLVFAGDGREWRARVAALDRGIVRAEVLEITRQEGASPLTLEVWCALVRPARFEMVVEKCTEAGADIIRPLTTARTARADTVSANRSERWERIAVEAAEQSGRLFVPVITGAVPFVRALGAAQHPVVVGDLEGEPWPKVQALLPMSGRLAVAVGPEGGWSPDEQAAARAGGALVVRLGDTTLRTETAAIVLTGLVRAST